VRINAHLTDPESDMHLWAESYERDFQDVLVLQSEMARAIAQEMEKDPSYALAHVGIADTWMIRGDIGLMPPREAFPKAMVAALKALELDGALPEVHTAMAHLRLSQWDWTGADAECRKAIQLNPSDSAAHFFYSDLLVMTGRWEEAQTEMARALELDPLNSFFQCFFGWRLIYLRRYDDAIAQLRKALGMEPNFSSAHMGLWGAYFKKGEYEHALAEARKFFTILRDHELAEALAGGTTEADYATAMRSAAEKLAERAARTHVPAIRVARLYAHAGERGLTLDWLEKAYEQGNPPLSHLQVAWDWDLVRAEPRYRDLERRMNFTVN
jgi:tetratricopeptide (TPR) repeat protein